MDGGGWTDGHHQPHQDELGLMIKELQQVGWDRRTDTLKRED